MKPKRRQSQSSEKTLMDFDHCDAKAIAPFVHTLTQEEHLEVVDAMESLGVVTKEHAEQLRALILEARKVKDLGAWVQMKCGRKREA